MTPERECNHTPKCPTLCFACETPIPENISGSGTEMWIVSYENGTQHRVIDCKSEVEAIIVSNVTLARCAGLCLEHLGRVTSVERIL